MAAAAALAGPLPPARQASLRSLRAVDGDLLDRALVLVFSGPASATGEDLVELHCHGGRAVVEAVEQALFATPSLRRAEPGEFTRRALLNGRIDLTEAAGLADLLEAETEQQRRAALAAAEGRVSRVIRDWMARFTDLSARVEASIDHAEEGDVEAEATLLADIAVDRQALLDEMTEVLSAPPVERWRDGVRVVIAGPPNAGKSTLINLLGGRDAAIVSPIAGTTRDRIEVPVRRDGVGYVLIDTAGLRASTDDPIEMAGMALTHHSMGIADLVLWLGDDLPEGDQHVRIHAKADLPERLSLPPAAALAISVADPASIERLWNLIAKRTAGIVQASDVPLHRREWIACRSAVAAIEERGDDILIQAEQLRSARQHLAEALGMNATEDMLDVLFSRFCIGK